MVFKNRPLVEQFELCSLCLFPLAGFDGLHPLCFWVVEEVVQANVGSEQDSDGDHHVRQAPLAFSLVLDHHHQQPCDKAYPNLYLYGVLVVSEEVLQREVLLQALEQGLYLPAAAVDLAKHVCIRLEVVGNESDSSPSMIVLPLGDAPHRQQLEALGMQPNMRVLPPRVVAYIVETFCIDV